MKAIYDWVHWFRELSAKIVDIGEKGLIDRARSVKWAGAKDPELVTGEDHWIDPFSFLNTLASKNTTRQRPVVYPSVHHEFGLNKRLPEPSNADLFIFPTPSQGSFLFHNKTSKHFNLLWSLFRQIRTDTDPISAEDFENVLGIHGVASTKLSHGLFLANPHRFLPIDGFSVLEKTPCATDLPGRPTYEDFDKAAEQVKRCFPGCQPFEINYFLYFQGDGGWITAKSSFFQISTGLRNDGRDFWPEFDENSWVRTSGKASAVPWDQPIPKNKRAYPVDEPVDGDIVLVRHGKRGGRGIGVVAQNDYAADSGLHERSRIHVTWINKTRAELAQDCPIRAMSRVKRKDKGSYPAFRNNSAYRRTFDLFDALIPHPHEHTIEYPRNQILYGPPGTGKTWSTVTQAVAIADNREVDVVVTDDRKSVKARFDELRDAGQIAMATFHQNYAYEDFIEGIRPAVADDSDGTVAYELRRGVFRVLADRATANLLSSQRAKTDSWDVEEVLQGFLDWVDEATTGRETIPLDQMEGKNGLSIAGVYRRAGGEVAGVTVTGAAEQRLFRDVLMRNYREYREEKITTYQDIKPSKRSKSQWHGQARYFFKVLKKMKEYHDEHRDVLGREMIERQNFILIIDEVNRGNIARIFGELITLVEKSRRIGGSDETRVTLPYSGDEFGVPENLYIIGTMNTADRSIALLDTALRRRFEFVEMMPQADHERVSTNAGGVDCRRLLEAMNRRIRFLLDREHQIGHTYFLDVDDIEGLRSAFQKKIVPLLQEYFYDDWAKIAGVLGDNGFIKTVDCPADLRVKGLVDSDAKAWEVLTAGNDRWRDLSAYREIYAGRADKGGRVSGDNDRGEGGADTEEG